MARLSFVVCFVAACAASCTFARVTATDTMTANAPPTRFEITSLPGHVNADGTPAKLPSRQFTGYIPAGTPPSGVGTMYFHYWLIESEGNPATDPVLIWYNGGPGASSLFGLLEEFGPLRLNAESYDARYNATGVPSLLPNKYRWTRSHSVVAIDSPPPMGLSFCSESGPAGNATSCGPWRDSTVAAANHAAHRAFFTEVFPELKSNPLYFTGESYAGIYVPLFADAMMQDPVPGLNFRGWAVGDGWTGCVPRAGRPADWCINLDNVGLFKYPNVYPGPFYDVEFFHGHSQFSHELYDAIRGNPATGVAAGCSREELEGEVAMGATCAPLIAQMAEEVGEFFPYNLYNACPAGDMRRRLGQGNGKQARARRRPFTGKHGIHRALHARRTALARHPALAAAAPSGNGISPGDGDSGLGSPCLGHAMSDWLAMAETKAAIGAPADIAFINLDNGHGFNYTSDQGFVGPIYERALGLGLRVLVYEGDVDACGLQTANVEDVFVPYFRDALKLNKTRRWRPWTTDGKARMGGYVIEWEGRAAQFVDVRGSGHLVPLNRPHSSYALINAFTSGASLPELNP